MSLSAPIMAILLEFQPAFSYPNSFDTLLPPPYNKLSAAYLRACDITFQ